MTQKYQVKVSMKQAAIVETGIVLKQGDFGMQLEIEVLDFDATGTTPQIVFRKAMGAVESTTITVSGNKYTYTFKGTELDTPGKCFCDLKLKNSTTQRISTASFMFKVVADTMDGLNQQASSYSDTIEQIISEWEGTLDDFTGDIDVLKNGVCKVNKKYPSNYNKKYFYDSELEYGGFSGATGALWETDLRLRSKYLNFVNARKVIFVNENPDELSYRLLAYQNGGGTYIGLAFDYKTTDFEYELSPNTYYRIEIRRLDGKSFDLPSTLPSFHVVVEGEYDNYNIIPSNDIHAAHQGYNWAAPNQTMPAFKKALLHGFDTIECDIQKTIDGKFILSHNGTVYASNDNVINPTYNAASSDYPNAVVIANTTYADLLAYDWGAWFPGYDGTQVATLDDLLQFAKKYGMKVLIDQVYNYYNTADLDAIFSIITQYSMLDNVYLAVGENKNLGYHLTERYSKIHVVYWLQSYDTDQIDTIMAAHPSNPQNVYLGYAYAGYPNNGIAYIHSKKANCAIFTVDDMTGYKDKLDRGVNLIISNRFSLTDLRRYEGLS